MGGNNCFDPNKTIKEIKFDIVNLIPSVGIKLKVTKGLELNTRNLEGLNDI